MRTWIFSTVLFYILSTPSLYADEIRVATEGSHPPFSIKDAKGQLTGFDVDLVHALCYTMQVKCSVLAVESGELLKGLQSKNYDAVIATSAIKHRDSESLTYTDPYYSGYLRFIAKMEKNLDLDELRDKTLGAVKDSAAASYLEGQYAGTAVIQYFENGESALQALKDGKLVAVLENVHAGYKWLAKVDNIGFDFAGEAIDIQQKSRIVLRTDDEALKTRFNEALKTLLENGTFQHINRNYFPFSIY